MVKKIKDKNIALGIISKNPEGLHAVSKGLRNDRDVALAYLKKDYTNVGYISERLIDDHDFFQEITKYFFMCSDFDN